jgi:hypothetical protein
MAAPTTLVVTYISTLPSTTSQVTVTIPKPDGTNPQDFTQNVRNIFLNGGFWFVSAAGVQTFVPWSMISLITAQ